MIVRWKQVEENGSGPSVPPSTPDPLGLIALFSSYDHITFAGRSIPLQQQWGIPFIFIPTNRARLQFLLTLLDQTSLQDPEV